MLINFHFKFSFNSEDSNLVVEEYEKSIYYLAFKYNINVEFLKINDKSSKKIEIKIFVLSIADESKIANFYEILCEKLNQELIIDFSLLNES